MKRILSLITLSVMWCYSVCAAYTVGTGANGSTYTSANSSLPGSNDIVNVTLRKSTEVSKSFSGGDSEFPDGTPFSTFGTSSIKMRADDLDAIIQMDVMQTITNVSLYYTGDKSSSPRSITVLNSNKSTVEAVTMDNATTYFKNEEAYTATIPSLASGTYYILTTGYTGGFAGIIYDVEQQAQWPGNVSDKESSGVWPISGSTTWDFAFASGTCDLKSTEGYSENQYYSYRYLYSKGLLSYMSSFPGGNLSFMGQYPIRNSQYAQGKQLVFLSNVSGAVRVTFSDTGSDTNPDKHSRYLAVNGVQTEYSVNRNYDKGQNLTTDLIPVDAGWVYISTVDSVGVAQDVRFKKLEFIVMGNNEGVVNDLFTQRVLKVDGSGLSTSTWTFTGYKNGTHGLVGGVEDNEIIYVSSDTKDKVNDNGNIKFSIDNAGQHFLSCRKQSEVYIPVPAGSSGVISITCTGDEYDKSGKLDRYFNFYKEDSRISGAFLPMLKSGSSYKFSANDISTFNGNGSYLKLRQYEDAEGKNEREMKVLTITVTLDRGNSYAFPEPEEDYDHSIGGDHSHSIFNYTTGDLWNDETKTEASLKLDNGSEFTGKDHDDVDSNTATIWCFRDGDLVKYKNQYYGALQLLSNADYTVTAPSGYYITTSIRLHGYNNKDKASKTYPDTVKDKWQDTYVSAFNDGKFSDNAHDNSFVEFARDDKNTRTTTLDFTIPAATSHTFNFSGYQFLGVIDAVIVPVENVPTVPQKVTYTSPQGETKSLNGNADDLVLEVGGIIKYSPAANEELWWYFSPVIDTNGSRGCLEQTISPEPVAGEDEEGSKDQNYNRSFSVNNWKFVNAAGELKTSILAKDIYDNKDYYHPEPNSTKSGVKKASPLTSGDNLALTIEEPGTLHYYVRNTAENLNSVLAQSVFASKSTSGIENVEVTDGMDWENNGRIYNVYGQEVDESYRGIVIVNGVKYYKR